MKQQRIDVNVEFITKRDEVSFRLFFDFYYQKLFHVAIYFVKSKELAEEIVSDVFVTIWRKRDMLPHINNIENYLYIITKNQALQYNRQYSTQDKKNVDLYEIELLADENTPEDEILNQEYRILIQEAIDSLPSKCKEVFRLYLTNKFKQKEIAQILNISIKTVESHIASSYKRIRDYMSNTYKK